MQAAISASQAAAIGGKVAQIYIPTPETVQSSIQYDELYPLTFSQPATYIRFSSTVEDCIGCPYNLTEEDDQCLRLFNEKRDASTQCSEDQFEEVMNFFEETSHTKQPFAAVDNPPVVTWGEMESAFDENFDEESTRSFAKIIYEHWKSQRLKVGNRSLIPSLKVSKKQKIDQITHCLHLDSMRPEQILTMATHTSVSGEEKSDKFVKRVVEMPKVRRSSKSYGRSSKMLGN